MHAKLSGVCRTQYLATWSAGHRVKSLRADNISKYLMLIYPISKRGVEKQEYLRELNSADTQRVTSLASNKYCLMLTPAVRSSSSHPVNLSR